MLEVIKSGVTEYGYWALGVLKYEGLVIKDCFSVNSETKEKETYKVSSVNISRNNKGILKIKLEI